ncbi:serum response factor-like protein [Vairimorpha necatrix]|uniref:Serum response factor-like protein n=1 Tax=Vairimorpha necatrix TaxID=6039 RepID=A0AAX4JBG7_9MICR
MKTKRTTDSSSEEEYQNRPNYKNPQNYNEEMSFFNNPQYTKPPYEPKIINGYDHNKRRNLYSSKNIKHYDMNPEYDNINPNFNLREMGFEYNSLSKKTDPKIKYIEEKNRRNVTFSKRKKGIMKKAYEISTLTGSDVLLIVSSESGHVFTYASERLKPFLIESKKRIEEYLIADDEKSSHEENYKK